MNTKTRHLEIYNAALAALVAAGGVEVVDSLPQAERLAVSRNMYKAVKKKTNCHYEAAKSNIAKAMRHARYGVMQAQWGGTRPNSGRPRNETPNNQTP